MSETYRKRGRVVRWENGTVVRAIESGVAIEDRDVLQCHPARDDHPADHLDATRVIATADAIRKLVAAHPIERLLVTEGEAEHDCDGRRWNDRSERVHLAVLCGRMRLLIDLATFALHDVARIADVLHRADDIERDAPERLRLAPNVAAALIPALVGAGFANVYLLQQGGGVDGRGMPIHEELGTNHYRPSYRYRPVRMPMNLAARGDSTDIDDRLPVAVALLEPVRGLTLRVLVDDGTHAWPATVRVTRIAAIAPPSAFYPYSAGSFGGEMML